MTLLEEIQQLVTHLPPDKQSEVLDFVSFLRERTRAAQPVSAGVNRKERLKNAFTVLAELGTFADIANPVEWQRQIRKDRPLPGRAA